MTHRPVAGSGRISSAITSNRRLAECTRPSPLASFPGHSAATIAARALDSAWSCCKSAAHRRAPAGLAAHTCPVCDGIFTANPRLRQDYCSPECRRESERQRNRTHDEERARRLGEHPRAFPPGPQPAAPAPSTHWYRRQSGTARTATSPSRSSLCSPPRKPPASRSPTASPTSARSDVSNELRLTVTDHRARRPDGRRARNVRPPSATGPVRR